MRAITSSRILPLVRPRDISIMDSISVTELIESQDWLEDPSNSLQAGVKGAIDAAGPAGRTAEDILHGVWLGHNLHPVLTDIPLGSWTAAAAMDTMEMLGNTAVGPGADAAVTVGLLGALGAAVTGLVDWHVLNERAPKRVGAAHAGLNIAATLLYAGSLAFRKRGARGAGRALAALGFCTVSASAYLGGILVNELGISVDHGQRHSDDEDFVPVMAEADLAPNTPVAVNANGTAVMLIRDGGRIRAIANKCSHLSGPLSEGKIENGAVTCPWHNSSFSLTDGSVLHGPATFPQSCFTLRIRKDQIEVKVPRKSP